MRIVQLVDTSIQFEPPVFALGNVLARQGHTVLCIGYWLPGLPLEEEVCPGYRLMRIPRGEYQHYPRLVRGGLRLARYRRAVLNYAAGYLPDLVFPFGYDVLPLAHQIAPAKDRIIYYCTEYSSRPGLRQYLTGWGFLKRMERRYVQKVGALISVEQNRAKLQERDWGRVVDYVILNTPLYDQKLEEYATSKISKRNGDIRLVYAGSIGRRNLLVELMKTVSEIDGVSLDIYGRVVPDFEDVFRAELNHTSTKSGGRIRYLNTVEYKDLARCLAEYDVGVSLYDDQDTNTRLASPAKLFEYMRSGLALLSTPQPTPRQVVEESRAGFLVDAGVPGELYQVVEQVVRNPAAIVQMRHNTLRTFRSHYAYERQAEMLIDLVTSMKPVSVQ